MIVCISISICGLGKTYSKKLHSWAMATFLGKCIWVILKRMYVRLWNLGYIGDTLGYIGIHWDTLGYIGLYFWMPGTPHWTPFTTMGIFGNQTSTSSSMAPSRWIVFIYQNAISIQLVFTLFCCCSSVLQYDLSTSYFTWTFKKTFWLKLMPQRARM